MEEDRPSNSHQIMWKRENVYYTIAKSYKPHNTLCERRLLHIDPFDKWIKLKRRGHLGTPYG